jgi:hypothetical protein
LTGSLGLLLTPLSGLHFLATPTAQTLTGSLDLAAAQLMFEAMTHDT